VRTTRSSSFSFASATPISTAPLALQTGWNLIALPGRSSSYTASSLLASINTAAGATVAEEVVRWQDGAWDGQRRTVPANAFSLEENRGYFVNLTAPAAWTP
jgi:hypothetical protein